VLDSDRHYRGIIKLDDVVKLADRTDKSDDEEATIKPILKTDYFTTRPETPIAELLEASARNIIPLAVVEESGHFYGIVTRSAILEGIAGTPTS